MRISRLMEWSIDQSVDSLIDACFHLNFFLCTSCSSLIVSFLPFVPLFFGSSFSSSLCVCPFLQDTAVNTHVLKDTKKQLKRHLKNAESTWKDVSMTVQLVEKQRDKFPHIDNSELYERRAFISTTKDRLGRAKAAMSAPEIKQKLLDDERAKAARRAGMNDQSESDRENTAFIADTQAQSSLLMQQQDETLDELGDAVLRVGEMAGNIQEEIGQQNKMLDEMEEDLSDAEEKLGLVMGKLGKMLKTKDRFQLITIIILTLVAIIMFFLVIYT